MLSRVSGPKPDGPGPNGDNEVLGFLLNDVDDEPKLNSCSSFNAASS